MHTSASWAMLGILVADVGMAAIKWGKPKPFTYYTPWEKFFDGILTFAILYWGGFFA